MKERSWDEEGARGGRTREGEGVRKGRRTREREREREEDGGRGRGGLRGEKEGREG